MVEKINNMKIIKRAEVENRFIDKSDLNNYQFKWSAKSLVEEMITNLEEEIMSVSDSKDLSINLTKYIYEQRKELKNN